MQDDSIAGISATINGSVHITEEESKAVMERSVELSGHKSVQTVWASVGISKDWTTNWIK